MIPAVLLSQVTTTRELPPAEWYRLAGTELETLAPKLRPEDTRIVVVERRGALLAAWAVTRMVHVEGVWIDPAYRKRSAGIVARLLKGMHAAARAFGAPFVWTGSESDDVTRLIHKLGGSVVPFTSYVLPIPREDV